MTAACIFERRASINQLKSQLGGSAEQRFDVLRIVDPRKLNEDPVLALPFDRRLLRPRLVDTPTDNLDRLFDGLATACFGRQLR